MKIGVSSYSYSQYLRSGKLNLMTVIAKAAEMGFEAIEFTDLPGDTYESRKALALQLKEEAAGRESNSLPMCVVRICTVPVRRNSRQRLTV